MSSRLGRFSLHKEQTMRLRTCGVALLAVWLASTLTANAQERFGNITGVVKDAEGLVVPGVTVTVTNRDTQRTTVAVTDAQGMYIARGLEPGRYGVKFELTGFVGQQAQDIILLASSSAQVDTTLKVGGQAEAVTVLAAAPLIDLESTTTHRNIPAEEFDVMPKGRSFQAVAAALPSVNQGELEGGFQVNGASAGENNFTVDGVSVVSLIHGHQ